MLESHVQQSQESITSEAQNMVGATTTILQQHRNGESDAHAKYVTATSLQPIVPQPHNNQNGIGIAALLPPC